MDHEESVQSAVDGAPAGTPERFGDKLNRALAKIGVVVEGLPTKTKLSGGPPCFRLGSMSYQSWLSAGCADQPLPLRRSMPGEPNYCYDCTPAFKERAMRAHACIFPGTAFEVVKEYGERVLVGISHSRDVAASSLGMYHSLTKPTEDRT